MVISRQHRDSQGSVKSHYKVPRPLFGQFMNERFAEEVRSGIISLTSRRILNVSVNQMFSKELTERLNKALKYRKEVLETELHLTIKSDYPAVLRSMPKSSRSEWKVEKSF